MKASSRGVRGERGREGEGKRRGKEGRRKRGESRNGSLEVVGNRRSVEEGARFY